MKQPLSSILMVAATLATSTLALAQAPAFTEYPIPTASSGPIAIATGPDGALWFTEFYTNKIGRVTTAAAFTEYPIPTPSSGPTAIAAGADNAVWFIENYANKIGRITTAGVFSEYTVPTSLSGLTGITAGPDGAVWFTESTTNKIGRITSAGTFNEYTVPTPASGLGSITTGSDGALWFTEISVNQIGRITTSGTFSVVVVPTELTGLGSITTGSDGALWFPAYSVNRIGRMTTAGAFSLFTIPMRNSQPGAIVAGSDGALWFILGVGALERITTAGVFNEYPTPGNGSQPRGLTAGPDGALWYTEFIGNQIGRAAISLGTIPVVSGAALPGAALGIAYSTPLSAFGGTPPYNNWTVSSGALPPGLALNPSTGAISGTPTTLGTFTFSVTVQDHTGATSTGQSFFIAVGQPPCTFTISPSGQVFQSAGGSGTITVTAGTGCVWSVSGAPAWVTITSGASGSGNGTVNYVVAVNTTSSPLSVTLTIAGIPFNIQQLTVPSFIGSMPHLAAEGGWITTFTLVNKGVPTAQTELSLFDDNGNPLPLPLNFPQQPSSNPVTEPAVTQTIGANASLIVEASGPANVPFIEGSAQVTATGSADGFAIFHYNPSGQEAVVPLETRNASSYVLAFDNTNGVLTGVAIENVSAQAANVPVILRDGNGNQIGTGSIPLGGSGHTSFVLSTQFPMTANIVGTIEIDTPGFGSVAPGQISVLGIRYTPPGTLTTIPALANVGTTGGLLAHLASAAGWQTTFVLVNTGASAASAQLNFYDNNGNPLTLPLTFTQTGAASNSAVVTQTIPAHASLWVQSAGAVGAALLTGSAQLTTSGNVSGMAIFRYNINGQEAVVPLESRNAKAYVLAYDNTGGTATGVAVSSQSPLAALIPVVLRDDTGAEVGTGGGEIVLSANGHSSFVLSTEFAATAGIRGTIEFDTPSGAEISVLGIRTPLSLTFTTLPPLAK